MNCGYIVRCNCPDGGDVIEGRRPPVETRHDTLRDALAALADWYRPGPSGPVRSATLHDHSGVRLDAHEEIARIGGRPLYDASKRVLCDYE